MNTVILIIIQVAYSKAKNLYKQRTVAKDSRSTLAWSQTQEENYGISHHWKNHNIVMCIELFKDQVQSKTIPITKLLTNSSS